MSTDNLDDKTARAALVALGRQVTRRAAELKKIREGLNDADRLVRIGAAAELQKIADEIGMTVEELTQMEGFIAAGKTVDPPATPEPPKAPAPTPARMAGTVSPDAIDWPKPDKPTPEPSAVPSKAPEPAPKPKKPKTWTRIKTWKFWAWIGAIIGAVVAYAIAAHVAGDLVRELNNRDSGFMIGLWTFVVWTLMTFTGFYLGGCIGERFDKKSG